MTSFQERPDGIVIFVGEGIVVITPIHPVTKADRLFRLSFRERKDPFFTLFNERGDAICFDIALVLHAKIFFDLDLNPESLAIEAILIALLVALHGLKALIQIFIGSSPRVVNTHRVVRGDRTIQE